MIRKLLVASIVVLSTAAVASAQTVRCESNDGRYHECRADGYGRVMLTRQLSDTACVEGRNWGTRNGMVWVSGGCRADFQFTNDSSSSSMSSGTRLTCESLNNIRHTCRARINGEVVLARRLSDNACVRGKSWGVRNNAIWVDDGCRAEFLIRDGGTLQTANARTLLCESSNNGRNRCSADTSYGVQLTRQISRNNCQLNRDWGYDQSGIWVDNGCRAEFTVGGYRNAGYGSMASSARPTLTCESTNGRRHYCTANTSYGVSLLRQLSDSSCVRGDSWGYDRDGVWVDKGCRAEFVLDSNR
ncbi:MAG TPA: DUF3011 domain-containing protein [Thermoanaerobaculia bacterium]|nr:DUF3011 domain-containing protein [Thermoanaerobaculia bacterium]